MTTHEICKTLKAALNDERSAPDLYYALVRFGVSQPKMASIIKDEERHLKVVEQLLAAYHCKRQ